MHNEWPETALTLALSRSDLLRSVWPSQLSRRSAERSQTGAPSQTVFPYKHLQTQFPVNPLQQRSVLIHLSCFTSNTSHVCPPVSFGNGGPLYGNTHASSRQLPAGLSRRGQFLPGLVGLISCPASILYRTNTHTPAGTHTPAIIGVLFPYSPSCMSYTCVCVCTVPACHSKLL